MSSRRWGRQGEFLRKRYNFSDNQIRELLDELAIAQEASFSQPDKELPVHSRDAKDDKVLRCAIMGKCDYLITGDEDLLILNGRVELGNLHIVKAADFLKRYLK
jgi:predicted nucleic acid-binding protein